MRQLTYEVIADGGTDRSLVPIIEWALHRMDPQVELLEPVFRKRKGPVAEFLSDYQSSAMLLFVHRDAEREGLGQRQREFAEVPDDNVVPVIPVQMTEAWLLTSGEAIARAADRPGAVVSLPPLGQLESLADPKAALEELLTEAAGRPTGRRGKKFKASIVDRRVNVAALISDFSPLDGLPSFRAFQQSLAERYPYGAP